MIHLTWFSAPWGKLLWTFTLIGSAVMLAVPWALWRAEVPSRRWRADTSLD